VGNPIDGVQDILGQLNVLNPHSYTTLNVNDCADNVGRNVTMNVLNPTTYVIKGLAPAAITFGLFDLDALNVTSGTGNDVFTVQAALWTYWWALTFFNCGGNDTII
jgi:hypothetical protein